MKAWRTLVIGLVLSFGLCKPPVHAHPLSPASLEVEERADNVYRLSFRRSSAALGRLTLELPSDCRMSQGEVARLGDAFVERSEARCARPLEGRKLAVRGLTELSLGALVSIRFRDGRSVQALLDGTQPSLTVPRKSEKLDVFVSYLWLGIEHLLTGADHLLFVAGLLGIVRGLRETLVALSAFTLGHSVTLCLSALSIVRMPAAPVELGIALSLLVVAHALTRSPTDAPGSARGLFGVVSMLGLLHGLGFAGALAEVGLPPHEIPLSLFAFNLGVEVGQVAVCLALAPLFVLATRMLRTRAALLRIGLAYGIGTMAALWCIERTLLLFERTS